MRWVGTLPHVLGDRSDRIRHDRPVTVWRQIADDLVSEIESGNLRRGDRLPSYQELAESYGVAPMTIRRAIQELRKDGIITVVIGKGTYVSE